MEGSSSSRKLKVVKMELREKLKVLLEHKFLELLIIASAFAIILIFKGGKNE